MDQQGTTGYGVAAKPMQAAAKQRRGDLDEIAARLATFVEQARQIEANLKNIADRIYGEQGEDGNAAGLNPVRAGAMGEVDTRLDTLSTALNDAERQANRFNNIA